MADYPSGYWRIYLKRCAKDPSLRKQHPEFWEKMMDSSKLDEDPCPPQKPRVGVKYQASVQPTILQFMKKLRTQ